MAADSVSIIFETNASSVSKSIAEMTAEINKLKSASRGGARQSGAQTVETLGRAFKASNRPDLSRQSDLNSIRNASRRGLTDRLETATFVAADMLKRTKGAEKLVAELNEGVGYAIDEGFRPLREASNALRKKASKTKDDKKKTEYLNAADEIDKYVNQYQRLIPGQKAAKRAFKEADSLAALEKAQTAFQKIGIEMGSTADLTKYANRLSQISPAIAQSVKSLRDSMDKISPQDYMKRLAEISMRGVSTLTSQRDAFTKQINTASTGAAGKGGAFRGIFEKRFGNVDDMLTSGKMFEFKDIADQTAFGAWKDSVRKSMAGYIQKELDPKGIKQLTALGEAKKTGDTEEIQKSLVAAERAVKTRLSKMYEQLAKLEDIAKTTKDRDLNNIITGLKRQIGAQSQVLGSQLADGALKVQKGVDQSLQQTINVMADRVRVARGSKTMTTAANIGKLIDTTDEAVFQGISDFTNTFKQKKFRSLGGKTMEGAGLSKDQQNLLNTQILGKTGFFSATTQEGRMGALDEAFQFIKPALMGVGLKGKELSNAEDSFRAMLVKMTSIYGELANHTQGLNAEISKEVRTRAARLVKEGKYDEARKLINDASQYIAADVNAGRPSKRGGGKAGNKAKGRVDLNPQAQSDMTTNADYIEGLIADRQKDPKNSFMGKLRQVSAFAGSILNVYGLVASVVGTVVNLTTQLIQKANELDKVASTVNALGGSFENFSQAMKVATLQQAKYGGTMTETMQGLTSLMPLTKRYGVDLGQLDNIARRLAVVDPLQGFQGASIALKEFFSGDITSLSRRFEIDRKSLNSIKAAGTQAEQLQALDKALNNMGISNDVLAAKTETAAIKFDRAGASWDNFQTIVGKSLQSTFAPTADAITNLFSDSGKELANITANEQYLIDLQKQLSRTAAQFTDLGEEIKPAATELDRFTSGALFDESSLQAQKKDITALIDEFNNLIDKLNEVRASEGKSRLRFFSDEDKDLIKKLALISQNTGVSVKVLLENLTPEGNLKTSSDTIAELEKQRGFFDGFITFITGGAGQSQATQAKVQAVQATKIQNLLPAEVNNTVTATIADILADPAILGRVQESMARNATFQQNVGMGSGVLAQAAVESTNQVNLLPDITKRLQIESLMQNENIDYVKKMSELRNKLQSGVLTQEEVDATLNEIISINKKLVEVRAQSAKVEDSYITNMAKSVQAFGSTTAKDSLVKRLDDITQKQAEIGQGILARLYGQVGGGSTYNPNNEAAKQIVKYAQEKFNLDRESLYYMNELDKRQAQMALNANKTVSAYTALTNLSSGLNVNLQDAVNYAMEFSSQMTGLANGSIFNQLSLADRLAITSNSLNNIGAPGGPQNPSDAMSTLTTMLSLRQEQADAGVSAADSTKKITEKYEKDKVKIQKDAEDERTKIMEDWSETTAKLIRESEYAKRAQTADFYESMFQNDNLTAEQQAGFSARREAIRAEADAVRGQDPAKAQLIMDAGEQQIKNEMEAAEKVAKYQKDNLEIDEELGDLQKDLARAKDEEDRRGIQKKIDKLNQQKLENQREIDQVIAVQKLRAEADAQKLKDAREGISEEQRARDKAIQDSKDKESKALSDLKTQRDTDLAEEVKARGRATKGQIADAEDYQRVVSAGNIINTAAAMAASGRPQAEVNDFLNKNLDETISYFTNKGKTEPAMGDIATFLTKQKALTGTAAMGMNPALAALASMFGFDPTGTIPSMSGPVSSFTPYTEPKGTEGSGGASGSTGSRATPLNLPQTLNKNAEAIDKNTTKLDKVDITMTKFNDNMWVYLNRRV